MSAKTKNQDFIATGRRKTSTARVRIRPGSGSITINNRDIDDYCSTEQQKKAVIGPLLCVEKNGQLDVSVNVSGGGGTGQSGAIRHGLSRALEKMDADLRSPLKKAGHLRRDPRKIERKKAGRPGARKRFQFSKR
jgi:small subunit ribosomal protein S9